MSNVSANDLAIVVNAPAPYCGKTCQVLYQAPAHRFQLPNGDWHAADEFGGQLRWVVKFPRLMPARAGEKIVMTHFGVGRDANLRRLAGPGVKIMDDLEVPAGEFA